MPGPIARADVRHPPVVVRPGDLRLDRIGVRHAERRLRPLARNGRPGEHLPVDDDGDLPTIVRHGQIAGVTRERLPLRCGGRHDAAQPHVNRAGGTGGHIELPHPEVALEDDGLAIGRQRWPEQSAVVKAGELYRGRAGCAGGHRHAVQVLVPVLVRHVVQRPPVGGPHGPEVLGRVVGELRVRRFGRAVSGPDRAAVDVRVAVPPPLAHGHPTADERDGVTVGRGCRVAVPAVRLGDDGHGRAAIGGDAVDVARPADLAAAAGEVEGPAVRRPGVEPVGGVVVRQPFQLARVEREDVDVAVARLGRHEREPPAVRRVERPEHVAQVGDQRRGIPAGGGDGPDPASRDERHLTPIRRGRRLLEQRRGRRPGGGRECQGEQWDGPAGDTAHGHRAGPPLIGAWLVADVTCPRAMPPPAIRLSHAGATRPTVPVGRASRTTMTSAGPVRSAIPRPVALGGGARSE